MMEETFLSGSSLWWLYSLFLAFLKPPLKFQILAKKSVNHFGATSTIVKSLGYPNLVLMRLWLLQRIEDALRKQSPLQQAHHVPQISLKREIICQAILLFCITFPTLQ